MSEHGDMGCDGFADVAAELSLGVLTGRERADALAHLEHCDACRETVRQLTMTGEQLLGLLPAAEPPAGFESRVLARLGIAAPDVFPSAADDLAGGLAGDQAGDRSFGQADGDHEDRGQLAGPESAPPGMVRRRRRTRRAVKASPPGHARPAERPGPGRGPGRRALATLATALAVVVAALGGWGLHSVTSPAPKSPLSSAALLSSTHQDVGQVYYYDSGAKWVYMAVDLPSGNGMVTCELKGPDGHYTVVGQFRLTQGYGAWGSPARWSGDQLAGARLLAPDGKVLATATF